MFRSAAGDLQNGVAQQRRERPEIAFDDQPPPRKLAPYAAAIGATVHAPPGRQPGTPDADAEIGWGSFVLLFDPAGQAGWGGPWRVIVYLRAELDPEIAADPLVGQVGWTWLTEALEARCAGYRQISGTVTRVVTEGFGAKEDQPVATEFELRASWSPVLPGGRQPAGRAEHAAPEDSPQDLDGHLAAHLAAWCDALCAACGLPPVPAGVSALRRTRRRT